jgi:hypothetical protein
MQLAPGPIPAFTPNLAIGPPPDPGFAVLARELGEHLDFLDSEIEADFRTAADHAYTDVEAFTEAELRAVEEGAAEAAGYEHDPTLEGATEVLDAIEDTVYAAWAATPGEAWEDAPKPFVPPAEATLPPTPPEAPTGGPEVEVVPPPAPVLPAKPTPSGGAEVPVPLAAIPPPAAIPGLPGTPNLFAPIPEPPAEGDEPPAAGELFRIGGPDLFVSPPQQDEP